MRNRLSLASATARPGIRATLTCGDGRIHLSNLLGMWLPEANLHT